MVMATLPLLYELTDMFVLKSIFLYPLINLLICPPKLFLNLCSRCQKATISFQAFWYFYWLKHLPMLGTIRNENALNINSIMFKKGKLNLKCLKLNDIINRISNICMWFLLWNILWCSLTSTVSEWILHTWQNEFMNASLSWDITFKTIMATIHIFIIWRDFGTSICLNIHDLLSVWTFIIFALLSKIVDTHFTQTAYSLIKYCCSFNDEARARWVSGSECNSPSGKLK